MKDLDDIIDKYAETPTEKRSRIISEALASSEGRQKLGEALGELIRESLRPRPGLHPFTQELPEK